MKSLSVSAEQHLLSVLVDPPRLALAGQALDPVTQALYIRVCLRRSPEAAGGSSG